MSDRDQLIEKSLNNPKYLRYWLDSLIDEQISDVKASLKEPMIWESNPHLIQEISQTLKDIHKEPRWVQKIFDNIFAIKRNKHKFKKRLQILLDRLQTDRYKIDKAYKTTYNQQLKVSKILLELKELRVKFDAHKNSDIFLKEIDDKISLIETYKIVLLFREKNLLDIEKIYNAIKIKGD
jgi:hypothetical protein